MIVLRNKTNVKLGGLNYQLGVDNYQFGKHDLFVGFSLNHAAGGLGTIGAESKNCSQAPTVLGFAANDTDEPIAFSGDYLFHEACRQGDLETFHRAMNMIFSRYMQHLGRPPKRVSVSQCESTVIVFSLDSSIEVESLMGSWRM